MPPIRLKHVVSFTSEDPKNPADNLLKSEDYYKWQCATPGESRCVVELQLEKASQIHAVDIGNNGAAFVEILVGRSSWGPAEEYKVLLVASSFMSPMESKSGTSLFRVRMFGSDKLNKNIAAERWDRVKIVCTQPYNKTDCYGLSFVKFHSPPEDENEEEKDTAIKTVNFKKKIGKFTLKDESDDDEIQIGSYFARKLQHDTPSSAAASARDASSSLRLNAVMSTSTKPSVSILPSLKTKSHAALADAKERHSPASGHGAKKIKDPGKKKPESSKLLPSNVMQTKVVDKKDEESMKQGIKQEGTKRKIEESKALTDVNEQRIEKSARPSKKVKRNNKNRNLPFHRIMRNVSFVLSGYKNPQRSDLRQQAISMGAEYHPDWGPGCTHLICAFRKTPKYNQVLGKGKIVGHKWITECAKRHERVSIKTFRLDGGGSSSDSNSDLDDIDVVMEDRTDPSIMAVSERAVRADAVHAEVGEPTPGPSSVAEELDDEECDTEDELRKAREATSRRARIDEVDKGDDDDDEYGGSTEDESDDDNKQDDYVAVGTKSEDTTCDITRPNLPPLPNYFNQENFLIYGNFEPMERRRLVRYITAYNGVVCDYMNDNVTYVVSDKDWDSTFDETAESNSLLKFIRPSWILKCHEEGMRVSPKDFQILKA